MATTMKTRTKTARHPDMTYTVLLALDTGRGERNLFSMEQPAGRPIAEAVLELLTEMKRRRMEWELGMSFHVIDPHN